MAITFTPSATNAYSVAVSSALEALGDCTWCCWVYRTGNGNGTNTRIFEKEYFNATVIPYVSWGLEQNGNDKCYAIVGAGGFRATAGSALTMDANTWVHLLAEHDRTGGNLNLYKNGTQVETLNYTPADIQHSGTGNGDQIDIGGYNSGASLRFEGAIAECAFWNARLGADNIAALAKGFSPKLISPSALKLHVPMVRAVQDAYGHVITTYGTPAQADHCRIILPHRRQDGLEVAAATGNRRRRVIIGAAA